MRFFDFSRWFSRETVATPFKVDKPHSKKREQRKVNKDKEREARAAERLRKRAERKKKRELRRHDTPPRFIPKHREIR